MRPDGRDAQQLRAMACETKTISMLDGSARYSHHGSCVLASVTGPIEAAANKQGARAHIQVCSCSCCGAIAKQLLLELFQLFTPIKVTISGCDNEDSSRERALQWHLKNVVDSSVMGELHPYCIIAVNAQVISEDGRCMRAVTTQKYRSTYNSQSSIESVIFNAVLCALMHAGIPLRRSFVSVTIAMCDGTWVIDPLASEQVSPTCEPFFCKQSQYW